MRQASCKGRSVVEGVLHCKQVLASVHRPKCSAFSRWQRRTSGLSFVSSKLRLNASKRFHSSKIFSSSAAKLILSGKAAIVFMCFFVDASRVQQRVQQAGARVRGKSFSPTAQKLTRLETSMKQLPY